MTFFLGMAGALAVVIAYAVGVWRGQITRRDPAAKTPPAGDPPCEEEKRRMREIYNFWHYDGGAMPAPSEDDR